MNDDDNDEPPENRYNDDARMRGDEDVMDEGNDGDGNDGNDGNDDNDNNNDDEAEDEAALFLDPDDAVDVVVPDMDEMPADEDDEEDDDDDNDGEYGGAAAAAAPEPNPSSYAAPARPDRSRVTLTAHAGPVYCLAVAAAGIAATGGGGGGDTGDTAPAAATATALTILTGGGDDCAFAHTVWRSPPPTAAAPATTAARGDVPRAAAVSQRLSYAHTDTVAAVALAPANSTTTTASQPPHRLAAVGGYDGAILVYDLPVAAPAPTGGGGDSEQPPPSQQTPERSSALSPLYQLEGPTDVEWLAFHPTGTVLLAGSATDGTVWMYHVPPPPAAPSCLQVFVGHGVGAVTSGGFTPDGRHAVTVGADGTLRVWAPKTGRARHTLRFGIAAGTGAAADGNRGAEDAPPPAAAGLTCLAFGPTEATGKLVLVGAEDGRAHLVHTVTGKVVHTVQHYEVPPRFNENDDDDDGDDAEGEDLPLSVEAVGFCPCQPSWCATGGVDGVLKIWDVASGGQCRQVCRGVDHDDDNSSNNDNSGGGGGGSSREGITRLVWHATLPVVFAATTAGQVRVWDARNGALLDTLTSGNSAATINDLQVLSCAAAAATDATTTTTTDVVVTASDDHAVRVFDVDVPTLLKQQPQQPAPLRNV